MGRGGSFTLICGRPESAGTRFMSHSEMWAGLIDGRGQKRDTQAMAFKNVDERIVKAFAVGEDGGHEFGRIIQLEPGGLIGLDAISSAVRFAKGIAAEAHDKAPNFGNFGFGAAQFAGALGELDLNL